MENIDLAQNLYYAVQSDLSKNKQQAELRS